MLVIKFRFNPNTDHRAMPKIIFSALDKSEEVEPGTTILEAANRCEIPLGQSCGGNAICAWCRVTVLAGMENLSKISERESMIMKQNDYEENERAACQTRVYGDVTVTTGYW